MTKTEKIEQLKVFVSSTEIGNIIADTGKNENEVLSAYLTVAENAIMDKIMPYRTGVETLPAKHDMIHIELAAYYIHRIGSEGESSHTENGISRRYENGYIPPSLLQRLTPQVSVL